MLSPNILSLPEILEARKRIAPFAFESPTVRLIGWPGPTEVYLKLENLQPTGSFKIRGAANALLQMPPDILRQGVWTTSAGNMAQALGWISRQYGVQCTVVAPENAPVIKLDAIRELGAQLILVPFNHYQHIQRTHRFEGLSGELIHPFADVQVMAGNSTIGAEIVEALPDIEAILVPYGGGGLSCGIAQAIRLLKPSVKVYACEADTASPLASSLAAHRPVEVSYTSSFISGIGAPFIFPEMWPLASQLLDGSLVVTLQQTTEAIRLLALRHRIITEGAGAVAVAAALAGKVNSKKVVCIVSGGNIDFDKLAIILSGEMP